MTNGALSDGRGSLGSVRLFLSRFLMKITTSWTIVLFPTDIVKHPTGLRQSALRSRSTKNSRSKYLRDVEKIFFRLVTTLTRTSYQPFIGGYGVERVGKKISFKKHIICFNVYLIPYLYSINYIYSISYLNR